MVGIKASAAPLVSAKTGDGIETLLDTLVSKIPYPKGDPDSNLQALIIDSWFDSYLGVVSLIRIKNGSIKIGERTNIQDNCVVHSDQGSKIGNNVTLGHGVVCHAKSVGDNCLLGNGSILNEGVEVGEFSLIAAGSVVIENMKIPPRSLVMGSPARIRGDITERHLELIKLSFATYVDKVKLYKNSEKFD